MRSQRFNNTTKRLQTLALLSTAVLTLGACEANTLIYTQGAKIAHKAIYGDPINVKATSYGAADFMDQSLRPMATTRDLIRVEPLVTPPNGYSAKINNLATAIPYQVGERFAQLGYNIDLTPVSDLPTSGTKNPDIERPRYILSGTFYPQARLFDLYREVQINLSIVDVNTKRVVSSFGYVLEGNAKVNDYSTKNLPKTREEADKRNRELSPIGGVVQAIEDTASAVAETSAAKDGASDADSGNLITNLLSGNTDRIDIHPVGENSGLNQ